MLNTLVNITVPKIKMLLAANKAQRVVNFSSFLLVTVNREKKTSTSLSFTSLVWKMKHLFQKLGEMQDEKQEQIAN